MEVETIGGNDGAKADEPFSLGEIDFGDELTSVAVQQVNPEELKPAQELLFAPLAEAQGKKESAPQDELPPLSIASRRKQSPLFMGLVVALVVAVVSVLGYVGYSMLGVEKVAKESGRISIRGVNAAFVKNSVAGELVVISGEAVNEFAGPRAAIQVKGMIYGPNGQVLASKNAFCGNPLYQGAACHHAVGQDRGSHGQPVRRFAGQPGDAAGKSDSLCDRDCQAAGICQGVWCGAGRLHGGRGEAAVTFIQQG